ncbi:porin [Sphingomonas solaris]|uniref:Porin n=1 Tax=Alterirhizorhabdus solaris TaxID=2529389 RepID=A0A558QWD5_9SPHN|nr:porin [Sphingomonas solaris]TVV71473.1 porin [Sphingomonas solaris]
MGGIRAFSGFAGGVLSLSAILCAPLMGATVRSPRKPAASLSAPGSLGSFTPAAADPRMAASFARNGFAGGFRFTPSSVPGTRRSVTVAVRARQAGRAAAERIAAATPALAPTAYNLGVAVGWKRFALSGDIARVDIGPMPGSREAMDVGLSYGGNKWRTRLQFGTDRSVGEQPLLVGNDEAYSVDLGGSYTLTRNLEVTGGLRYRTQRDRLEAFTEAKRDSQAVYVGTAFKF